jgi:catechol 2,3-dioxygenase-like lactoylglutathione lyase family enzyme
MQTGHFDSVILYVADLSEARSFYADALGLPVLFEDEIAVVVGGRSGRVVLHRNDRGHDERGTFPAGTGVGGAAVRFAVDDPDACEGEAHQRRSQSCSQPRRPPGAGSSYWLIPIAVPWCSRG